MEYDVILYIVENMCKTNIFSVTGLNSPEYKEREKKMGT